jgi:asparagine N-glycosylation enzyme membrane subunit Stt3
MLSMRNRTVCLSLVGLLLILELLAFYFKIDGETPRLTDTDCYMWLVRAERLYDGHGWYDAAIARANWPYGHTLHWARLLDILLLAGAYTGALVTDFKTALFWWAMIISPLLHVVSLAALFWAASPLFGRDRLARLGLLFLGQMGIWGSFAAGRPDHHSLLLLLFIILLGFIIRMTDARGSLNNAVCAGATAATAMWVSVESLAAVAMAQGIFAALWLEKRAGIAGKAGGFSLVLW